MHVIYVLFLPSAFVLEYIYFELANVSAGSGSYTIVLARGGERNTLSFMIFSHVIKYKEYGSKMVIQGVL